MMALKKHLIFLFFAVISMLATSCIYDEVEDCAPQYRVRFYDDQNLKYADAFDAEVTSMSLYVFDETGYLVWSGTKQDELFEDGDFFHSIDISHLAPGKYHLVAWGGLDEDGSFTMPTIDRTPSILDELTCSLKRQTRLEDDYDLVDTDINDLFYGTADIEIHEDDDYGMHTFDIHLTKDTHRVTVVLQQLNGKSLDPEDFDVVIEAGNGHLNHDNRLLYDEKRFLYRAYEVKGAQAGVYDEEDLSTVSTLVARLTISRLEINDWELYTRPSLAVYNAKTGSRILSIPLIDYLLLVRSYYHNVSSDQDYLDRQDEYNFTFFLNDGYWLNSEIVINSWRIILNNDDLGS